MARGATGPFEEGAGGDGCHVDEYGNMVQELEPGGRVPYQCHILDRLYDPYGQDPTGDLAEAVTASVPEEVHAQPRQEHEACPCRVLHELYINNIAVHFAAGKGKGIKPLRQSKL